jgi:primosomal protein N' (replication factor Y)
VSAGRVVRVLADLAAVAKQFDYLVPASLDQQVRLGTEVRVQLHGRRVWGWVVAEDVTAAEGMKLSSLLAVRGWGPPERVVELSDWAAWRWAGPPQAFLKAGSPARVVRSLPVSPLGTSSVAPRLATGSTREPHGTSSGAFSGGCVVVRRPPADELSDLAVEAASRLGAGCTSDAGVLVLLPEHRAAGRMARHLRAKGFPVAQLPEEWARARAGGCVVVGTRAAALAPMPSLSAALVIDAHDETYREERAPTWCAWEVVVERARREEAPCALVSPCPTLELLRCGRVVEPSRIDERLGWSFVEVVDRRADDPRTGLFSERVVSLVRWAAAAPGRRVLCVLNRTGRLRLVACGACRELARCERCGGPVEQVEGAEGASFRCRRCEELRPVVCSVCGGTRMKALRVGVTRAREELEALAGTDVQEVWGRPTGRDGHEPGEQVRPEARLVVGTEAVLHRMDSADAVVFLDFDSELLAPRMRASEEALALLARASRLVARSRELKGAPARSGGRVVVQTRLADHEVLSAATAADPSRYLASEEQLRSSLGLPPFTALAHISGAAADAYGSALRETAPGTVRVNGPAPDGWWVTAPGHEELCNLLAAAPRPRGRVRVSVDPVRA